MRIGIDARMHGSSQTGIGNYTKFLIDNLSKLSKTKNLDIKFFVFLQKKEFSKFKEPNINFTKVLADYNWYSFEEQIKFPILLYKYRLDLMHFTHFNVPILYKKKFITTIHDLIPKFSPGPIIGKYWHRRFAYNLVFKNAVKKSKYIITPSQYTKKDILKYYNINENKIKVIYEGADHIFTNKKEKENILNYPFLYDNYILYLGVIRAHKNLIKLVKAFNIFKKFQKSKYKLILAGPDNEIYTELKKEIKKLKLEKNIIITGKLTEKEKIQFISNAKLVVLPSLHEGFGLVPLEAIKLKKPVAVSNIEPLKEILKNSAFFFNPNNEKDIAKIIKHALTNKKEQKIKLKNGLKLIKKYKWSKMAKEILALYIKN